MGCCFGGGGGAEEEPARSSRGQRRVSSRENAAAGTADIADSQQRKRSSGAVQKRNSGVSRKASGTENAGKCLPGEQLVRKPSGKAVTEIAQAFDQCLRSGDTDSLASTESFGALAALLDLAGPEDPALLAVLQLLKGDEGVPWELERGEWNNWLKVGVYSPADMRTRAAELRERFQDPSSDTFHRVYNFTFYFVRQKEAARTVDAEVAVAYWELLLTNWSLLPSWIAFWKEQVSNQKGRRAVTRDEWAQLLEFSKDPHALDADAMSAWPTLMDDFVEWYKQQKS
eukprot:Hpha_TRINITY_DN13416_c0_g1::TRINITY_DN13416_c0_g1_i1::g.131149::m.131149/K17822/DCUN1D1_2; DCN1-like protein 1/2